MTAGRPARAEFLAGLACALLAAAPRCDAIDWSFPGEVGAYARRLGAPGPFVHHDDRAVMPAASTIKLAIALAAIYEMQRARLPWSHQLTLRAPEIVGASETFGTYLAGERASIQDLMRAMIAQSDNTAANVLADWVGFSAVNAAASRAGMHATSLRRHFMDFAARAAGIDNTTTARDMGVVAYGLARGMQTGFAGVAAVGCKHVVAFMEQQEDRETIPSGVGRAVEIANKTGDLPDVRHDVAIVGLGRADAYVVALLSSKLTDRNVALARLREIAAQIDLHSSAPACSSSLSSRFGNALSSP